MNPFQRREWIPGVYIHVSLYASSYGDALSFSF